jgi:hypothetical protein
MVNVDFEGKIENIEDEIDAALNVATFYDGVGEASVAGKVGEVSEAASDAGKIAGIRHMKRNNKSILRDNFAYYKETGSVNTK